MFGRATTIFVHYFVEEKKDQFIFLAPFTFNVTQPAMSSSSKSRATCRIEKTYFASKVNE